MEVQPRVIDVDPVPAIYADCIVQITLVGDIVRVLFGETRQIAGERVRVPVIELVRPIDSGMTEQFRKMLAEQLRGRGEGEGEGERVLPH